MIANMNEKGRQTKLLAAIAILVMVVAACAMVMPSVNAADEYNPSVDGPLNFKGTSLECGESYGTITVNDLAKDLVATYDEASQTYTVTGTLLYQALGQSEDAFYKIWTDNKECHYGLPFSVPNDADSFTVQLGDGNVSTCTDKNEECLFYINPYATGSDVFEVKVTVGTTTETYTVDYSGINYRIALDATTAGSEAENWTYSGTTLTLDGYNGVEAFYGGSSLTVTLKGENSITVDTPRASVDVYALYATTLNIGGTGSLAVTQNAETGFGIVGTTLTIGDATAGSAPTTVTSEGGNRAIYAISALTIQNADVTASASEKAIRVGGGTSNEKQMTVTASDVTATISGTGSTNGQGNDDIFGIKTGKITIDDKSSVNTEGLRVEGASSQFFNDGTLIVKGGYTQNASADLKAVIAGVYFDNFVSPTKAFDNVDSETAGNHLVNGDAFGVNVEGISTTVTVDDSTADDAAKTIADAINENKDQMVVLDVSKNSKVTEITIEKLNGNDVVIVGSDSLKDVTATINTNESVTISGVSSANLEFTNGDNTGSVTNFTGTIIVSQGSLDYQIIDGSGDFKVAGESGFTGTVTGDTKISGSGNAVLKDLDIQSGILTLGKDIAFTIEGTLTNAGTIAASGATIDITSGNYVSEAGTITATVAHSKNTMQMEDVKGTYTLQRGSVAIAGEGVTFEKGMITISGQAKLLANVTVSSGVTITINEGATLTTGAFKLDVSAATSVINNGTIVVSDKGALVVGDKFTNEEAITVYGNVTVTGATNNGTITVLDKGKIDGNFSGTGSVDMSGVSSDGTLGGTYGTSINADAVLEYPADQNITLNSDTTLVNDITMKFYGTLVIPEGMTLTISNTALLVLYGQSATIVNNGTIVIQATDDGNGLAVSNGAKLQNNGTITVQYTPTSDTDKKVPNTLIIGAKVDGTTNVASADKTDIGSAIINNGSISVGEQSTVTLCGFIQNNAGAAIDIDGKITSNANAVIKNAGTVNVNGAVSGQLKISNSAVGATVSIEALNGTVFVDDAGITSKDYVVATNTVSVYGGADHTIGGIVITSATYDVGTGKDAKTYKTLDVSGTVSVAYTAELAAGATHTHTATETKIRFVGDVTISGDFSIAEGNTLIFGNTDGKSAKVTVSGNMTVPRGAVAVSADEATEIVVSGMITSSVAFNDSKMDLNAASYSVESEITENNSTKKVTTYYYTTLEKAIASGSKAVTVYGDIEVTADITIPAEVVVTQDEGSEITVGEDATVTVEDKGAIANGNVVVEGTLYVANAATGFKDGVAISEVYSSNGTDARYTNLKTAMAAAQSGDTVTLNNAEGCEGVTLELTSFTIKDGVTLNTNGMAFKVIGTTLTIDGTLLITDVTKYEFKDADNGVESSIVLNGYIKSQDNMAFDDGRFPAGAYYSVDEKGTTYNYITTVANAAQVIDDVDSDTVRIHGAVSVGEVAFASEATDGAYVYVESDATVTGTISIDNVTLTVNGKIAGSVTDAAKSGTFTTDSKAEYGNVSFTVTEKGLAVTGAPSKATITGTVYLAGYSNSNAELVVDGTAVTDGAVTIGTLTVNGDVVVSAGNTMTVTTAYVYGGLSTESTDADGVGTANIATMYAGIDSKMASADAATVEGNVVLKNSNGQAVAYVSAASVVPGSFADATKYVSTQFVVDGAEWITVYGTTGAGINYIQAPIENAKFIGWATEEGKDATITSGEIALGGENDILYAVIDRNVYTIRVIADDGIGTVSLDGRIFNAVGNQFTLSEVAAGTYELDFVLKSGFEGSPTMTVEGQTTTGYTFTVSGDFGDEEDVDILIYLSGTTPVTSGGEIIVNTGSDDMSLTDILLIVLVVLIVIMAVIVALRLMRS